MHAGRNSTSYYTEANGMKSQRDRVIQPVSLSELTRLRSKSPLASLRASGVGVGGEEETFTASSIWQNFSTLFFASMDLL